METRYVQGRAGSTAEWTLKMTDDDGAVDLTGKVPVIYVRPKAVAVITANGTPDTDQVGHKGEVTFTVILPDATPVGWWPCQIKLGTQWFPTSQSHKLAVDVAPKL